MLRSISMNNNWNRIVYTFWSPIYDWLISLPMFVKGRKQAWELANLKQDDELLLVGIGTGADIRFIPECASITGVDLNPSMLKHARKKAERLGRPILFIVGNAEQISRPDDSFDVVALNLILGVVENPRICFQEAVRLTKPGGRIIVFDKFVTKQKPPSLMRRVANIIARPFGTDLNRNFEEIIEGIEVTILEDQSLSPGSAFRTILIRV